MYNIAILYFTEGGSYMEKPTIEERKIANEKFRFAMWCLNEAKQLAVNLRPEVKKVHSDLNEINLDVLHHIMLGNCYSMLYSNLVAQEAVLKINNIGIHYDQSPSNNFILS